MDQLISFGTALLATLIDLRFIAAAGRYDRVSNFSPAEAKKIVSFARKQLKLSNDELDEMAGIAASLHQLLTTREPPVASLKRFLARPYAPAGRQLLRAVAAVGEAVDRIAILQARLADFDGTDVTPPPLLTGDQLIRAGARPGPLFKQVLDSVYDAQLEDLVKDEDAALRLGMQQLQQALSI